MPAEPPSPEAWAELAETVVAAIESALADAGLEDLDIDRTGDVLSVEFEDGVKYVVSLNREKSHIYVAAEGEGLTFTYQPDDGDWCSEDGRELLDFFGDNFAEREGVSLDFG